MVAFWPDVPAQLNQLRKLEIITCIELAAISAFAVAYGYQVWRHNHEAQPDAQLYLQTSLYPAPTTSHRYEPSCATFTSQKYFRVCCGHPCASASRAGGPAVRGDSCSYIFPASTSLQLFVQRLGE